MPDTCPAIRLAVSARARLRDARCRGSTPPGVGSARGVCVAGLYAHARVYACRCYVRRACLCGNRIQARHSVCVLARRRITYRAAGKDSLDSLRGTKEAGKDELDSLQGTREVGKGQLDSLGSTREAPGKGPEKPQYPFRVKPLGFRVI